MQITNVMCPENKYSIKCPDITEKNLIVVHNTYNDASAMAEISYMIGNNNKVSFHVAVDDYRVVTGLPFDRSCYAAGDGRYGQGNGNGINIEICYSKSGGEKFDKSEENAAQYIAYLLKQYNWGIDRVKKHQDFSGKYCPHRTLDLGWERFLNKIRNYLEENMKQVSNRKSNEEIAQEVIEGKWSNGEERKTKLTNAGYNYNIIQNIVNNKLSQKNSAPAKKSNEEIAQEVINGAWGNGNDRKTRLQSAGYDYNTIQSIVNQKLTGKSTISNKKSNETIADEVIKGLWGNGDDRKNKLTSAGYNYNEIQAIVNKKLK